MKTRVTVETITAELDEARALALRCDQPSAAISATATKAKLHGLIVDRKESGQPGDFAGLQSEQAVLDRVREELGDETALLLTAALAKGNAEPEVEVEPDVAGPGDTVN